MDLKHLGEQIEKLREAAGLTQIELSAAAGVSRGTIQQLEKGIGNPELETLDALAGKLKAELFVSISNKNESKLFALFRDANDRNAALILGYAQGLLNDHQPPPHPSGGLKRSN